MLFDLRSRGRRRTVQGVYLGLAILMGGGLVLFGVGAGNGLGGLLNAFTGNGSGGNQKQVVSQQVKAALRQTQLNPSDPAAWAAMVSARWTSAGQGSNFDTNTSQFTASGKKELNGAVQAWQRYLKLTNKPDPNTAIIASRAYLALGNYAGQAGAWEIYATANPTQPKGFECLAAAAYAAKQTRKGDLATAKALALLPKSQRLATKQTLEQAKTNPQVAQSC
jgi:predicted Zn-dependent protease